MKMIDYARRAATLCVRKLSEPTGQGTAEYAILVAVLVIAAIAIISAVGGQVTSLWTNITNGLSKVV